jgi:hypothetical protein
MVAMVMDFGSQFIELEAENTHLREATKSSAEQFEKILMDTFFVDTDDTIEVFKCTSRIYGAALAFQLLM